MIDGSASRKPLTSVQFSYKSADTARATSAPLTSEPPLDAQFEKITQAFLGCAGEEYAASRGEYLNAILLAAFLGYEFVDAAEVIRFDKYGNFQSERPA